MIKDIFIDAEYYARKMERFEIKKLTLNQEKELIRKAKKGSKTATTKLLGLYYKYIIHLANKQYFYVKNKNIDVNDLISVANIGFIKAIQKFDTNKDIRLYSYALWDIRSYIQKQLAETLYCVKVPLGTKDALWVGLQHDEKYLEFLTTEDFIYKDDVKKIIKKILQKNCTKKEQIVFMRKHGIDYKKPHKLTEIAKKMGCTPQSVSLTYKRVCKKLRENKIIQELKENL